MTDNPNGQVPQSVDAVWLGKWLTIISGQLGKIASSVSWISTVATIFLILAAIGLVLGGCSVLMNLGS